MYINIKSFQTMKLLISLNKSQCKKLKKAHMLVLNKSIFQGITTVFINELLYNWTAIQGFLFFYFINIYIYNYSGFFGIHLYPSNEYFCEQSCKNVCFFCFF